MAVILLIEDDTIVQHVHTLMLNKLGHQVDLVETAAAALAKLQNNPGYDVVFVDIGLPDRDGPSLIKEIRSLFPDIPIIVLTGYIGEREKKTCLAAGATDVIHKPILMNKMMEVLNGYL